MKKFMFIIIFVVLYSHLFSQSISIDSIVSLFQTTIESGNLYKNYDKMVETKGFNFSTMKPENKTLYDSVFVRSYYKDSNLIRVEVIDTMDLERNFDIAIIYESDEIYIGFVQQWRSYKRKSGYINSDLLFINYKINKIPLFIVTSYGDFTKGINPIDINKNTKFRINKPQYIFDIIILSILDERLYFKNNFYFTYENYIFNSEFLYVYGISEYQYIFNDSNYLKYNILNITIDDLLKIIELNCNKKYNYYEKSIHLNYYDIIYWKNKPNWLYFY